MKVRLFLFLAAMALVGVGTAHSQCSILGEAFPPPGNAPTRIPNGTCITAVSDQARLRWDITTPDNPNGTGLLQLFDTDETGMLIWCDGINDPGGCDVKAAPGGSLCLQDNGEMKIWTGSLCGLGTEVFSSGTQNTNTCGERLRVKDSSAGEQVVIENNLTCGGPNVVWVRGSDPS